MFCHDFKKISKPPRVDAGGDQMIPANLIGFGLLISRKAERDQACSDIGKAFARGMTEGGTLYHTTIGMGAWRGTIMLFNVGGLIWPNQKKILGMVTATPEEIGRAKRVALLASRTNTLLSIPLLMFMGGAAHGLPF